MKEVINTKEYKLWINNLKQKFQKAQIKASVKVNSIMLEFYWELGKDIIKKQENVAWGSGFLKQLSVDLRNEFPDITGFSHRNIKFIKQWYTFYYDYFIKGKQLVSLLEEQLFQIPWGHNIVIIQKIKNVKEALFYVNETSKNGWSRVVLTHQIESKLYERQGKAINNFSTSLPKVQSDLAREMLKAPYNFVNSLTEKFKSSLPSVEEIEAELMGMSDDRE